MAVTGTEKLPDRPQSTKKLFFPVGWPVKGRVSSIASLVRNALPSGRFRYTTA